MIISIEAFRKELTKAGNDTENIRLTYKKLLLKHRADALNASDEQRINFDNLMAAYHQVTGSVKNPSPLLPITLGTPSIFGLTPKTWVTTTDDILNFCYVGTTNYKLLMVISEHRAGSIRVELWNVGLNNAFLGEMPLFSAPNQLPFGLCDSFKYDFKYRIIPNNSTSASISPDGRWAVIIFSKNSPSIFIFDITHRKLHLQASIGQKLKSKLEIAENSIISHSFMGEKLIVILRSLNKKSIEIWDFFDD